MRRRLFLQVGVVFYALPCLVFANAAVSTAQSPAPTSIQPTAPASDLVKTPVTVKKPLPSAPAPTPAQQAIDQKEAERISKLAIVNGRPYERPTAHDQFIDYLKDSYGLPAFSRSFVRSLYGQSIGKPEEWGQDWPGYGQRLGTAVAVTAINGNVRYGMESIFHEDMRYIPCHGCRVRRKIGNAFLAEVTARHDSDGHRFFTLTPIISDFPGSLIANSTWIPDHGPLDGLVGTRTVVATRVATHLFREFVLERRHKDPKLDD